MRLFVAVEVGAEAVAFAGGVRAALERHDGELCRRGLKWVDGGNLHLTLRFIGEVQEPGARDLIAALGRPVSMAPFRLAFGPPAWLPRPSRPRVLVLPASSDEAGPLVSLKQFIDQRMPPGVPPDDARPFRPHLTIARVRDEWEARAAQASGTLEPFATGVPGGVVTRAVVFESHLGPRGPRYVERASAELVPA